MIWILIAAYLSGLFYEAGCVFWIHFSEAGKQWPAVGWSMFNAIVTITGVEAFLTGWPYKLAYVLGFGSGTYVAIRLKKKLKSHE